MFKLQPTESVIPTSVNPPKKRRLGKLPESSVPFVVFGALWYMLIAQLSTYWAVEPEYSFGWFVPPFGAYLFLIRWRSRPPAEIQRLRAAIWIFCAAGLALLPTWVMAQPNPDWRLMSWLLALETVVLSLCAVYFVGGTSWLKHFAFSICLILTAVPWPGTLERAVVHVLTQFSTSLTVAALNLGQIHAVQQGNLVELSTGSVEIDGACSGIRSLQAAFMLSLFLGEAYRAAFLRRSVLVLGGVLIACVCNVGRTLLLTVIAAKEGIGSMANWHDPIGYTILTACFLLLWGLARAISGPPLMHPSAEARAPARFPNRLVFASGGWILFTVIGTEIWYRAHETPDTVRWSVSWPVYKQAFADISISKPEAESLSFDEGRGAEWTNEDGSYWVAYFFRWAKGPSRSRILARAHRPENCLPGAGYKPCGDHGIITVQVQGISIPFRALDFEDGGNKVYVFFCLWEDGLKSSERPRIEDKWSRLAKLRSVVLGQRNLGQQTLEIVTTGYGSSEQAEAAFRREIVRLIETEPNKLVVSNR
jgi:exosortase